MLRFYGFLVVFKDLSQITVYLLLIDKQLLIFDR